MIIQHRVKRFAQFKKGRLPPDKRRNELFLFAQLLAMGLVAVFSLVGCSTTSSKGESDILSVIENRRPPSYKYQRRATSLSSHIERSAREYEDELWPVLVKQLYGRLFGENEDEHRTGLSECLRILRESKNLALVASLSAVLSDWYSNHDADVVHEIQGIISDRIEECSQDELWQLLYAFEQSVYYSRLGDKNLRKTASRIEQWRHIEADAAAEFQMTQLLWSLVDVLASGPNLPDPELEEFYREVQKSEAE